MQPIYLISGLGADERVFYKLKLQGYQPVFVKWIMPFRNETVASYSKRLAAQIPTENPILIGLSFGGMMAIEIAKHIKTHTIILISSAKSKNEIPFYYRVAGVLKLNKIIPTSLLVKSNIITNKFFTARTNEDKNIVSAMLKDTNTELLKWSINIIVTLKNKVVHKNLIHIHGTADRILPIKFIKPDIIIKSGTHLMIMNKADEINFHIVEILKN